MITARAATLLLLLLGAACGGSVQKNDDGAGGGDDAAASTTGANGPSGATTSSSTSTGSGGGSAVSTGVSASTGVGGGGPCDDHADCPGGVCLFGSGTCSTICDEAATCGAGLFCDFCGTSSCEGCDDCREACVPAGDRCDGHDDCGDGDLCVWELQACLPDCGPDGACPDGLVCDDCGTSSCPGCRDCEAVCVPGEDPGCVSHEACGDGLLCVFDGAYCTAPCDDDGDCGSKAYCDDCLTSSCPECRDCVGGCVYLP